ncbi:MAG: PQQ-binding-like beta-propeller repeat protein [Planctomycetes bacterium]|nr:PQQ-binding-like beta-propeller repeat protein [Planctomycetota bacterium]
MPWRVLVAALLASAPAAAEEKPGVQPERPEVEADRITVRLVADLETGNLVSDLEQIQPVVKTLFDKSGTRTETIGERVTLWVRNAHVDGKFFFERFYQEKYINRSAELHIDSKELGAGEHHLWPGGHRFNLDADGRLSSSDPEIRIEGRTISLKLHKITVLPVDGSKGGPPDFRLISASLGLYLLGPDARIELGRLPDPQRFLADAPLEPVRLADRTALTHLLSHARSFYPLSVYLPSNRAGQGYALYPSWQAFHVTPEGQVDLLSPGSPPVQGITSEASRIVIPYRVFQGKLQSSTGLRAFVGRSTLSGGGMGFSPTLEPIRFIAGIGEPDESFFLTVDPDLSKRPNKLFLADNQTANPHAVRLLALEWEHPVFIRGDTASVALRFLENSGFFRADDVSDWPGLLARWQQESGQAEMNLGKAIWTRLGTVPGVDVSAWKGDAAPDRKLQSAAVRALNACLSDRELLRLPAAGGAAGPADPEKLAPEQVASHNRERIRAVYAAFLLPEGERVTVPRPVARVSVSPYNSHAPAERQWSPVEVVDWRDGFLSFRVSDLPYDFYFFRVQIMDESDRATASGLQGEIFACVIEKGQEGSAAFISNKGRTAFLAGEDIRLQVVLRSRSARPAGRRRVTLQHPDGRVESFPLEDAGGAWHAQPLDLPKAWTRQLPPGNYLLGVSDLPPGVVSRPFRFDLVSPHKSSLFHVVKPSKYTQPMNELVASWSRGTPIDLERAVATLAEMGYNRLDHMTYSTDLQSRYHTEREDLASTDDRLMPPESVFMPSPRDQILDACVRHGLEFSDVFLSYNDFHLPRYIEGYVQASQRWIQREMASMRHSPALDGMMLYDEMYQTAASGFPDTQPHQFAKIRDALAVESLGKTPAEILGAFSRYLARPKNQRDPEALRDFLRFRRWELHGWGDYNGRVARAARAVAPGARIGTYHRTWMVAGNATGIYNGYPPDVFDDLDLISCVHYSDNSTGWVHSSMMANALRFGPRRPLFINIPVTHENYTRLDGQYQRHMAFAMMAQGADGVSQFGLLHDFVDGPNLETMTGKETTRHLNREILAPFGELVTRTDPGYSLIGIVSTLDQQILSEFKEIPFTTQTEELWVACWRLGYPATFLAEDAFERSLERFRVIFVPGVRFDGELSPKMLDRLREAIRGGCRVVVEKGSELALPGILKLDDMSLSEFYLGLYFPSWHDDELNKVFEKSQTTTDYLAAKLPQWVEPAARGAFKVGPNWRSSGHIHYLIMANFDDPDYNHTVRQTMAKPVRMPLRVPSHRGRAAYDLLAQEPLTLSVEGEEAAFVADMSRVEGALIAFLPEPVGRLQVSHELARGGDRMRLSASLLGASGNTIPGVFPTRIRLLDARGAMRQEHFRVLGQDLRFELDLPGGIAEEKLSIEVREAISGQTCHVPITRPPLSGPAMAFPSPQKPFVPFPDEIARFRKENSNVRVLYTDRMAGLEGFAREFAALLQKKGIAATVQEELDSFRYPDGDPALIDPMSDGFHSWRARYEVIQPVTVVDAPVILLGGKASSYLLEGLAASGFLTELPIGGPGCPARPTLQVAPKGLHWKFDTLCLVANDVAGLRDAARRFLEEMPPSAGQPATPGAAGVPAIEVQSRDATSAEPAVRFLGSHEFIGDIQFDRAGNLYAITWGHGKNLYSFDPSGKLRFARRLPEMGAVTLGVFDDRLLVFTAAGARLYQLGLDGQPISQIRLTLDPGSTSYRDGYSLGYVSYEYLPESHRILYNNRPLSFSAQDVQQSGSMRILDEDGRIAVEWHGEPYQDKQVSDRTVHRGLENYAFSPDRTRLAQVETTVYWAQRSTYEDRPVCDSHMVLRDLSGKKLHEYLNVANDAVARVQWIPDAPGPAAIVKGEIWQFDESLRLLSTESYDPGLFQLTSTKRLVQDGHSLRLLEGRKSEVARFGPFAILPSMARLSPDGKKLALLDEYGLLHVLDAAGGQAISRFRVPQLGLVLRFTPASDALVFGGIRGLLLVAGLDGQTRWQASLSRWNDPADTAALYDPSFRDLTPSLWPEKQDEPGDLDALVKLDGDRLVNGDCESSGGWQGAAESDFVREGFQSPQSLKVGRGIVHQEITRFLGNHVTWVLEFHYKAAPGHASASLIAGLAAESRYPDSVGRRLAAAGDWQFGRIVLKSGMQPKAIKAGFSARSGEVLIDAASLRSIRFPSINHLLYEPLHMVKPVILTNPLFAAKYNPVGNLRDEAPNRVIVEGIGSQVGPDVTHVESAFLQNGRLNDMGSTWYIQPLGHDTTIAIGLKEPRWVSLVGLYFNAYDEANVTPHFDVLVTDVESKEERLVASVRHNRQLFRLLKFPPVRASQVTLKLVNAIKRLRTLTEIEVYGPLSGQEGAPGFADPDGQNTYMGSFARVDKRAKVLSKAYKATVRRHDHSDPWEVLWGPASAQILVSEGKFYVSRALGWNEMYLLDQPTQQATRARAGGLGFSPYVTLYGGLLIKPGYDGKLYCIDAPSSRELWATRLGDRLQGSPVAVAEDVFAASDTGRLYKLDLANGSILMDEPLSAGVTGSLATDGENLLLITNDGFLQNYDPTTGKQRWALPVARFTDSTPAVDGGLVYLADQKGLAQAVDIRTGAAVWTTDLGQEFARCPVVTDQLVIFGCSAGRLAALRRPDGQTAWSLQTQSRFDYEPVVLGNFVLHFNDRKGMLASLSDGSLQEAGIGIEDDPMVPISYYQGKLFIVPRHGDHGHGVLYTNHPWHVVGGQFYVFAP